LKMHLITKLSVLLVAATACASPARFGGPRRRQNGYGDDTSFMVSTVTVAPYPYLGTGTAPITPTVFPTATGANTALPTAITGTESVVPTLITITTTLTLSYQEVHGTDTTWVTTTTHRTITVTEYHTQYVTIPDVPTSTADSTVTNAAVETTESTATVTSTSTQFKTITVYPNESTGGAPQSSIDAGNTVGGCASPVTVTVTEPGSITTVTVTASASKQKHKPSHHSIHPTYTFSNGTLPTSGMSGSGTGTVSIPYGTNSIQTYSTVDVDPTETAEPTAIQYKYRH